MGLEGKRILVVGGGSGIGYAVAEAALAEGARAVVASSNPDKITAAAARLGAGAEGRPLDVTDEGGVQAFFDADHAFDHIVFTAGDWGGMRRGTLESLDLAAAADTFKVRFWGAVAVAKHGARRLPAGGSFTLTNGTIAHRPSKGSAISTAMAGGLEHLTRALAVELAPIRVNCVCPAMISTEIWDSLIPAEIREERIALMTQRQLIPRIGTPQETAQAYLYSMKGGYTTGQVLMVEGGVMLGG
ncbi:SDR family oxidoreductase [Phenylobacterium soli]|uniref:Short-chain dehydrogenase n=1 Tax=Phenylobacterium soli TaxID=2170551 RepID=A0A328AN63_9CAUL|nr:SDR family oxidoreductase [Phenylobacterium soli]RAK55997.1 short-chain dehydrogenase [Phenylobacterium soli]